MKRRIEKQLLIQSPIVMYPRKKLYLRGIPWLTFKGYLTTKAPGFNLSSLIQRVKLGEQDLMFDDVLRIYYDKFLPLLLRENTCFFDVSKDHVFIDDNIFIADTDFYEIRPKWISERQKNQNNLYAVNRSFYNFFYGVNPVVHQVVKPDFQDEAYLDYFITDLNKKTAGRVKSLRMLYDYDKIK